MKYRSKPFFVEAFCFSGSEESAQAAQEWLSAQDVENAELTYQTNSKGSTALDLTTAFTVQTLEKGDYLCVTTDGKVYATTKGTFEANYEQVD